MRITILRYYNITFFYSFNPAHFNLYANLAKSYIILKAEANSMQRCLSVSTNPFQNHNASLYFLTSQINNGYPKF